MTIQQYKYMEKSLTHGMFVDVEWSGRWQTVIPMKDCSGDWREGYWKNTREDAHEVAGIWYGTSKEFWLEKNITQIIPYFVGEPYKIGDEVMYDGEKYIIEEGNENGHYRLEDICCDIGHTALQPPAPQEDTITIEGKTYNKSDVVERLQELKEIK